MRDEESSSYWAAKRRNRWKRVAQLASPLLFALTLAILGAL